MLFGRLARPECEDRAEASELVKNVDVHSARFVPGWSGRFNRLRAIRLAKDFEQRFVMFCVVGVVWRVCVLWYKVGHFLLGSGS